MLNSEVPKKAGLPLQRPGKVGAFVRPGKDRGGRRRPGADIPDNVKLVQSDRKKKDSRTGRLNERNEMEP